MEENKAIAKLIFDLANKLDADPEDLMNAITMKGFFDSRKQSKDVGNHLDELTYTDKYGI
jgi:hypothetical protein